ncbi:MAG: KH domain-containing protein [Oscillospiraceae bacterium]|jgi:predicted RNA-binding protein YlqC (UPF0109 family)|nr:KH domain-containing protein [Oscillospiraceae bacterium]
MKELLYYLVESLVDNPDAIEIEETERDYEGEPETLFRLRVASADMGKVIGRQGRTAKDIRILLRALASREGKHVSVDVLDESE